jgi:hypothetical protein
MTASTYGSHTGRTWNSSANRAFDMIRANLGDDQLKKPFLLRVGHGRPVVNGS